VVNGAVSAIVTQGQASIKILSILRGPDPSRDPCVLMTETPLQLPAVPIAAAEDLRVGQRVFASGGGLFDTEGRLVGVTDSVAPGGANLGFAYPAQIRVAYRQFLLQARPRAFLITSDNKFGVVTNSAALTERLKGCAERKVVCAAYAVDNTVVWGKQQPAKSATN
jgi:serine protease Do